MIIVKSMVDEERAEFFDDLDGEYCMICGVELPEPGQPGHECPYDPEDDEDEEDEPGPDAVAAANTTASEQKSPERAPQAIEPRKDRKTR